MKFSAVLFLSALIPTSLSLADSPRDLKFSRACETGQTLSIAAVGDVLLHGPLQAQAQRQGHQSLWRGVSDLLRTADIAYANLEGPTAEDVARGGRIQHTDKIYDGVVYTGYPTFNYHPRLNSELLDAGFDVVSTANNHAMDRGRIGVDRTIESLQRVGLPFAGTRTSAEANRGTSSTWHVIVDKNGWRTAWISCTFSTNGIPDGKKQVLMCFQNADLIAKAIHTLSQDRTVDAVIVTPHWGEREYTHVIEPSQARLARRFLNAGATAILGNHPHVTKPWEKIITDDGRETFVIYSIGNFVSAQGSVPKQTSAVVYVGLTKKPGQKAFVNGVRYVPLYMRRAPYTLVAGTQTPRESQQLLARLLGTDRRMDERDRLNTTPECRR